MLYADISHIFSLVSIDTLERMLDSFMIYLFKCQAVSLHDRTNVRIFPDGKLFTQGFYIIIPYNIIDAGYLVAVNLSCLSLLLIVSI